MFKKTLLLFLVAIIILSIVGCTKQEDAQNAANDKAADAEYYLTKNDLDRKNYNMRQKLADDPSTILWVTCMFPSPSSPMITVPIIGKLTSSNKRPYPLSNTGTEDAGPDGMYGSSAEYRYGFGPNGISEYYEFYNISTYATTMPTIWQREKTTIVMENDPVLVAASNQAKEALKAGDSKKAEQILIDGIKQVQKIQSGGK